MPKFSISPAVRWAGRRLGGSGPADAIMRASPKAKGLKFRSDQGVSTFDRAGTKSAPQGCARGAPMVFRQRNSQRFDMDMSAAEVKRAASAQPNSLHSADPNGSEILVRSLHAEGVKFLWAIPGGPSSTSTTLSTSKTPSSTSSSAMSRRRCTLPTATRALRARWALPW